MVDIPQVAAAVGSALDRLEWTIGVVASGDIDQDARNNISDAMFKAMAEIRAMQADIAELRAAGMWLDIADAPHDGEFEVANADRRAVAFRDSGMSSYRWFSRETEKDLSFAPTHYRPLPSPPKEI